MKQFFGHGAWEAPIWLVGAEHGSLSQSPGELESEVQQRIDAWMECGRLELTDWHASSRIYRDDQRWLGERPPIQATYGRLIHFLLAFRPSVDREDIRQFQSYRLGRAPGRHGAAIIELRPLPSKNMKQWHYPCFSDLNCLQSRKHYYWAVDQMRVDRICQRAVEHRPRLVVIYGADARERLAAELGLITNVAVIAHPTSRQGSGYFREQGLRYAELLRDCLEG